MALYKYSNYYFYYYSE